MKAINQKVEGNQSVILKDALSLKLSQISVKAISAAQC